MAVGIVKIESKERIFKLREKVLQAEKERLEGKETISVSEARKRLREVKYARNRSVICNVLMSGQF